MSVRDAWIVTIRCVYCCLDEVRRRRWTTKYTKHTRRIPVSTMGNGRRDAKCRREMDGHFGYGASMTL